MIRDKRALDGLDQDIKDHIERQTQDNIDTGMAPEEARRQAMLKFGNVALVKEDTRAIWVSRRLDETRQDVRYALRAMRRTRGATIVGILVMALGIGANTAVFSVVHAVLLNPLPYADPDRIVTLTYLSTGGNASGERSRQVSVPDFLDWQAQSASFDSMAYYTSGRTSVMAGSVAEYAVVTTVTEEFFRVFAGQPSVGRSFSREEAKEGGAGAAMISDRYARQQFGEPARGLGRTLRLGNRSVTIVGVMPPAFDFPVATDVWFTAVGSRARAAPARQQLSRNCPIEGRRQRRTGTHRNDRNFGASGRAVSRHEQECARHRDASSARDGRRCRVHAVPPAWRGRPCSPDRLRDDGDATAGQGYGTHSGNGGSRGAGRKPLADREAAAGRGVGSGVCRRDHRRTDCDLGHENTGGVLAARCTSSRRGRGQWQRAPVHAGPLRARQLSVRTAPGAAGSPRGRE